MGYANEGAAGEPGRTLWLVRHGESTWNALGLVQGQRTEPRLTGRGAAQARAVARHFRRRTVRALYTSDLLRAVETARPVAAALGLEPVVDERLRERAFGSAEGTPSSQLGPERSGLDAGRVVDPDAAPSGGESVRQLRRRVRAFLDDLDDLDELDELDERAADDDLRPGPAGDVVLVVHGGVVRAALAHLDRVPVEEMAWGPVGNGQMMSRPLAAVRPPSPVSASPPVLPGAAPRDATPPPVPVRGAP